MVNHHESSINGPFSIAMWSNQRVLYESGVLTSFNHVLNGDGLEPIFFWELKIHRSQPVQAMGAKPPQGPVLGRLPFGGTVPLHVHAPFLQWVWIVAAQARVHHCRMAFWLSVCMCIYIYYNIYIYNICIYIYTYVVKSGIAREYRSAKIFSHMDQLYLS